MIYPKMALSNIKKNGKLYIPYIITSVLTVMMFFMVNSLVNSDSVAKMEDGENIISLLAKKKGNRLVQYSWYGKKAYINSYVL